MSKKQNPWDAAKALSVVRGYGIYKPAELEPGVKFFVLMIEQLGGETCYSCEGHPSGFYVMFKAPLKVAQRIDRCGYFGVELSKHAPSPGWRLSLDRNEWTLDEDTGQKVPWTKKDRDECLRLAASNWTKEFGPLKALACI
jgi:hypothetical protein